MNFLEERIAKDGIVKPGNVLKVDSFLNHQMDIALLSEMGREFKRRFEHKHITKILTIEASGIAIAFPVAYEFGVRMMTLSCRAVCDHCCKKRLYRTEDCNRECRRNQSLDSLIVKLRGNRLRHRKSVREFRELGSDGGQFHTGELAQKN